MGEIHCYHCGTSIHAQRDVEWFECAHCKEPLDVSVARRWGAAGRVVSALGDPDLDPDLRLELRRILHEHRAEVKRRGLAASGAWSRSLEPESPPVPAPADRPEPDRTPRRRERPPAAPSLWTRLGPLFTDNLIFALGGFHLLAAAV